MVRLENRIAIEVVKSSERSQFLETSPVAEAGLWARRRCCNAPFIFLAGHRYALRARIKLVRYLWQRKSFNLAEGHIKIPNLRKNPGLGFIYVSSFFCSSLDSKAAKVPELSLIFVTENLLNF